MDNGTTASYAAINMEGKVIEFKHVPTFKIDKWTKPKKKKGKDVKGHITVIDINALKKDFKKLFKKYELESKDVKCYLERPAVGFSGWSVWTSLSGISAWVSVQYVLLDLGIEYYTIDSKEWQSNLIPQAMGTNATKKLKSTDRNKKLKEASDKFALEVYPEAVLRDSGDGDSINIAYNYYLKEQGML